MDFCENCKRSVPSVSFTLHSVHCRRFMKVCEKCEEPIPITQIEEHNIDVHSLIQCLECQQQIEKGSKDSHNTNDCPKRLVPCEFCEMKCSMSDIEGHTASCGSRTEKCDVCNNYVLICMLKIHQELHSTANASEAIAKISSASNTPAQITNGTKTQNGTNETQKELNSKTEYPKFRNVICQNLLQASASVSSGNSKQNDEVFAQKNVRSSVSKERPTKPLDLDDESPILPCEFCGVSCVMETLEEHQLFCKENVAACTRCQKSIMSCSCRKKELNIPEDEDSSYWSKYPTTSGSYNNSEVDEEPSVPCSNCSTIFPISCIELHEVACRFSDCAVQGIISPDNQTNVNVFQETVSNHEPIPVTCALCDAVVPSDLLDAHEVQCNRYREDETNSKKFEPSNVDKDPEVANSVPCTICGILFPDYCLEIHQVACEYAFASTKKKQKADELKVKTSGTNTQKSTDKLFQRCPCCRNNVDADIFETHKKTCNQVKPRIPSPSTESLSYEPVQCSFCEALISVEIIDMHEACCKDFHEDKQRRSEAIANARAAKKIAASKETGSIPVPHRKPSPANNPPSDVPIQCSFCEAFISAEIFDMHEACCKDFHEEKQLRFDAIAKVRAAKKNVGFKNSRSETPEQRTIRNNTSRSAEVRLPYTPKIQQSKYTVVRLPNDQEILKKRNPDLGSNVGASHVLGGGLSDPTNTHTFGHGAQHVNETLKKRPSAQHVVERRQEQSYSSRRTVAGDVRGFSKPSGPSIKETDKNDVKFLSKKTNVAFKNNAFQPDPGNRLGYGQTSNSKGYGGSRASAMADQLDQQDTRKNTSNRDQNNGAFFGARPKRPH